MQVALIAILQAAASGPRPTAGSMAHDPTIVFNATDASPTKIKTHTIQNARYIGIGNADRTTAELPVCRLLSRLVRDVGAPGGAVRDHLQLNKAVVDALSNEAVQ